MIPVLYFNVKLEDGVFGIITLMIYNSLYLRFLSYSKLMKTDGGRQARNTLGLYQRRTFHNEGNYNQGAPSESFVCNISYLDGMCLSYNSLLQNEYVHIYTCTYI